MEAGEGSNGREGREDWIPPDELETKLARGQAARGLSPDRAGEVGSADGSLDSGTGDREPLPGTSPDATPAVPPGSAADTVKVAPRSRPWSEPEPAPSGPIRCHFLRSVGPDGRLADPQKVAVPTHRCAAFGDPLPLSLRQQELVCLQRVHVSCPRYVHGTLLADEEAAPTAEKEQEGGFPLTTVAAVVLVIAAIGMLLTGPVLGVLPFGGGSSHPTPSVSVSPSGTATVGPSATPRPTATIAPSLTPAASPTAPPTAGPSATPAPTPGATSSWPPGATASRMDLVVPCSDQPNCYIYTVRSGNVLAAIANFFGVDLAMIRQMNPSVATSNAIYVGEQLKIPPPTK